MKTSTRLLTGFLLALSLLFISNAVSAADHHGAHALQHTTLAVSHGEQGHNKILLKHAQEALKHTKMAAQVHHEQHLHLMKAIKLLDSSINNANNNKAKRAAEDANKALAHIHKSLP